MGLYSHNVGHHYDVIWVFDDYHVLINAYAFGKDLVPNIHYKLCTTIEECHPWCLKQQGQHQRVALMFIQRATELTCPLTFLFALCHQDVDLGLNCFAPNVKLWYGIWGYHCAQMFLCNNQWGKEICRQLIN